MTSGTLQLVLSDPNSVALFKNDGTLLYGLGQTDASVLTLDLAHPSGYLSRLLDGNLDVWLEGRAGIAGLHAVAAIHERLNSGDQLFSAYRHRADAVLG